MEALKKLCSSLSINRWQSVKLRRYFHKAHSTAQSSNALSTNATPSNSVLSVGRQQLLHTNIVVPKFEHINKTATAASASEKFDELKTPGKVREAVPCKLIAVKHSPPNGFFRYLSKVPQNVVQLKKNRNGHNFNDSLTSGTSSQERKDSVLSETSTDNEKLKTPTIECQSPVTPTFNTHIFEGPNPYSEALNGTDIYMGPAVGILFGFPSHSNTRIEQNAHPLRPVITAKALQVAIDQMHTIRGIKPPSDEYTESVAESTGSVIRHDVAPYSSEDMEGAFEQDELSDTDSPKWIYPPPFPGRRDRFAAQPPVHIDEDDCCEEQSDDSSASSSSYQTLPQGESPLKDLDLEHVELSEPSDAVALNYDDADSDTGPTQPARANPLVDDQYDPEQSSSASYIYSSSDSSSDSDYFPCERRTWRQGTSELALLTKANLRVLQRCSDFPDREDTRADWLADVDETCGPEYDSEDTHSSSSEKFVALDKPEVETGGQLCAASVRPQGGQDITTGEINLKLPTDDNEGYALALGVVVERYKDFFKGLGGSGKRELTVEHQQVLNDEVREVEQGFLKQRMQGRAPKPNAKPATNAPVQHALHPPRALPIVQSTKSSTPKPAIEAYLGRCDSHGNYRLYQKAGQSWTPDRQVAIREVEDVQLEALCCLSMAEKHLASKEIAFVRISGRWRCRKEIDALQHPEYLGFQNWISLNLTKSEEQGSPRQQRLEKAANSPPASGPVCRCRRCNREHAFVARNGSQSDEDGGVLVGTHKEMISSHAAAEDSLVGIMPRARHDAAPGGEPSTLQYRTMHNDTDNDDVDGSGGVKLPEPSGHIASLRRSYVRPGQTTTNLGGHTIQPPAHHPLRSRGDGQIRGPFEGVASATVPDFNRDIWQPTAQHLIGFNRVSEFLQRLNAEEF